MSLSNFAGSYRNGVIIRGNPIINSYPGKVWWVNSSSTLAFGSTAGSDNNDGTYQRPFSTIAKATSMAVANRGDVVFIMPGHAQTLTGIGSVTLSKAGVAYIGLGNGTLRPTLQCSSESASIYITAANITVSNFRVAGNFADITNAIVVTSNNCHLDRIEFIEQGTDLNFLDYISCTGANNSADFLTITGCSGTAIDAGQNSFLNIAGDLNRLTFIDNNYCSTSANTLAMILCATGKDLTNCRIEGNRMFTGATAGDLLIDNDTAVNTGIVADNLIGHADTAGEILIDADGVRQFNNRGTALDTASGYILPAIDS